MFGRGFATEERDREAGGRNGLPHIQCDHQAYCHNLQVLLHGMNIGTRKIH